jgi:septum formation protein
MQAINAAGKTMHPMLVLASTSPYRRELLARLGLPFKVANPRTDESPLPGESPPTTALRLAEAKARAVAADFPDALIIGSDQVAEMDGRVFGKPGSHERAVAQLKELSGRTVNFFTGLCLLDTRTGEAEVRGVPTLVGFRELTDHEIENYLRREPAYNCAGSAKSEGLGIALLERLEGTDPNALVGLPLIALCELLRRRGVDIL